MGRFVFLTSSIIEATFDLKSDKGRISVFNLILYITFSFVRYMYTYNVQYDVLNVKGKFRFEIIRNC